MNFLKQFFGMAVQEAQEFDAVMASCQFESSNNDCSLVQQLKQKQAEKREVEAKIKDFETSHPAMALRFEAFLMEMERYGFEMGCHHRLEFGSCIHHYFQHRCGVWKLKDVLSRMSDAELNMIFEELRALKHRAKIFGELRSQANQLSDEIDELKTKLGIE